MNEKVSSLKRVFYSDQVPSVAFDNAMSQLPPNTRVVEVIMFPKVVLSQTTGTYYNEFFCFIVYSFTDNVPVQVNVVKPKH